MKVLLTGGGTAGHVNPALAIAAALTSRDPHTEILFAASALSNDKAGDLIPRAGYELRRIHIRGLRRPVYSLANLRLPFVMLKSRREAKTLIREFQPDLIVGTGGYACWPVVSVGASMGIPTAVHESNALPGKAICQVKNKVDLILVNFPETINRLGLAETDPRVLRVGNPYMADFGKISPKEAKNALGIPENHLYILSFGGSLGAEHVNDAVLSLWEHLKDRADLHFCHAAGKRDYDRVKSQAAAQGMDAHPRMTLLDYIYDMPLRMAAADVVISRAGAMSISELALMKKAAVLVPSPYVADNHQFKNAMALHHKGAGLCVEEKTLATDALTKAVESLLNDSRVRQNMQNAIFENFAMLSANETIVAALYGIVKSKDPYFEMS
ncbi:MAG: UDP-N-acetylglucosamine--N-acetylmuramyl-(pentapeptide) pyrophosphoryl-undecaprenol N-acetylglucosamine transferase [Ruminococcaceae bacterium]|nr:UDP-N-acetylglucosamine--N-acetylmuramyl-(pentapeptide) pyrophosphoryl-undecaprenol N-acetylglucosamine transferase [Oscillospiraceae bacterium]